MNRFIPENIIEDIQARCDIIDLINSVVPLKKAGSNPGLTPSGIAPSRHD